MAPAGVSGRSIGGSSALTVDRHGMRAVILVAAVAFLIKCLLAFNTVGTTDSLTWENFARFAEKHGPVALYDAPIVEAYGPTYQSIFNHPPLMALGLRYWTWISQQTHLPIRTLLRIAASIADLGTLLFVCLAVRKGFVKASPLALCALAGCPVSIMIAGFHGNTDAILAFFLVVSVYALECGSPLLCGILLGLACDVKVVPVILVPALVFYLRSWRDRIVCLTGLAAATIPTALIFAGSLDRILKNMFGYASMSGHWGTTWLWYAARLPDAGVETAMKWIMLAALMSVSFWMNTQGRRWPLFTQWGVLLFLFLFLTPGFGIQYLIWVVPWVVALGATTAVVHYGLSGLFAFGVYTFWCGGLPWDFANGYLGDWHGGWVRILQVLAWLSTLYVLWRYWRTFGAASSPRR